MTGFPQCFLCPWWGAGEWLSDSALLHRCEAVVFDPWHQLCVAGVVGDKKRKERKKKKYSHYEMILVAELGMVNLLAIPEPSRLRLENLEFKASLSKHSKNELVSNTEIGQRTGGVPQRCSACLILGKLVWYLALQKQKKPLKFLYKPGIIKLLVACAAINLIFDL